MITVLGKAVQYMRKSALLTFCVTAGLASVMFSIAPPIAFAEAADEQSINVVVKKVDDLIIVDANLDVPVTQRQAWDVLVDFEHMPRFVPNLQSSVVTERSDSKLRVAQASKVPFGFLSISVDTVREVDLKPYEEIRSHVVGGTLKKGDATTKLNSQGSGTHIVYHSETISGKWIPPGLGVSFVRTSIRDQFDAMRNEMIRRQGSGS